MIRYTISFLALAIFPSPTMAELDIPIWCCPSTCQFIDGDADNVLLNDERGPIAFSRNGETIPFSKDMFRGNAPDGLTRVCIGYTFFGDPEIKCLISQMPLM